MPDRRAVSRIISPIGCLALVSVLTLMSSGCASKRNDAVKPRIIAFPKANAGGRLVLVGSIKLVNDEASFVLVDTGAFSPPPAGTLLKFFQNGTEGGILRTSPERRGGQVAADIVSGEPQRGDQVFQ